MAMENPEKMLIPIVGKLEDMSPNELIYAVCRFILEVRKKSGENFPAETVQELVTSLQTHLEVQGRNISLLESPEYEKIGDTLDNRMKDL